MWEMTGKYPLFPRWRYQKTPEFFHKGVKKLIVRFYAVLITDDIYGWRKFCRKGKAPQHDGDDVEILFQSMLYLKSYPITFVLAAIQGIGREHQ